MQDVKRPCTATLRCGNRKQVSAMQSQWQFHRFIGCCGEVCRACDIPGRTSTDVAVLASGVLELGTLHLYQLSSVVKHSVEQFLFLAI